MSGKDAGNETREQNFSPENGLRSTGYDHLVADFTRINRQAVHDNKHPLAQGPVASLDIPSNFTRQEGYSDPAGSTVTFRPRGSRSAITSLERNETLSDKAAGDFRQLLNENVGNPNPKTLTPDQIKSLSEVLGRSLLGDNQYTNKVNYPSNAAPLFHINDAKILQVQGKPVLAIEGSSMDSSGRPTELYRGILMPGGKDGKHINELFFSAPDQKEFAAHKSSFSKAMKTIKWR